MHVQSFNSFKQQSLQRRQHVFECWFANREKLTIVFQKLTIQRMCTNKYYREHLIILTLIKQIVFLCDFSFLATRQSNGSVNINVTIRLPPGDCRWAQNASVCRSHTCWTVCVLSLQNTTPQLKPPTTQPCYTPWANGSVCFTRKEILNPLLDETKKYLC